MVDWNTCSRLCGCFPRSFINGKGEQLIPHWCDYLLMVALYCKRNGIHLEDLLIGGLTNAE